METLEQPFHQCVRIGGAFQEIEAEDVVEHVRQGIELHRDAK